MLMVKENIFFLFMVIKMFKKEMEVKFKDIVMWLGIYELVDKYLYEISGG